MPPTFPKFTPLTLDNKEEYKRLIADYPPYSDILFTTLQIWWNLYEQLAISYLNGNIVIRYRLPFDEINSGYGLVGKNKIDESIQNIFKYLSEQQEKVRLVHVPEFAIREIKDPGEFSLVEELDYNEYILDSDALAKLEGSNFAHIRTQLNRFIREVEGKQVELRSLNLSITENQNHLFQAILDWEQDHPPRNDPERTEHDALKRTLTNAVELDVENLTLYINDKLHGLILYHQTPSKDHFVVHHLRFDYSIPYTSDYLTHHFAKHAIKSNVPYINMEMDLGSENLRKHKMKLRPVNFYRKYTVLPVG